MGAGGGREQQGARHGTNEVVEGRAEVYATFPKVRHMERTGAWGGGG